MVDKSAASDKQISNLTRICATRSNMKPKLEGLSLEEELGRGEFCRVYVAKHNTSGNVLAVKVYSKRDLDVMAVASYIKQETELQAKYEHENIVKVLRYFRSSTHLFIFSPYIEGGTSLHDHVKSKGGTLDELEGSLYVKQLASALHYCHQNNAFDICIDPRKLLIGGGNRVMITSLAYAVIKDTGRNIPEKFYQSLALEKYQDPTKKTFDMYTDKVDSWSLGVTMFQILTGRHPMETVPKMQKEINMLIKRTKLTESAQNLLRKLIKIHVGVRIPVEVVPTHPWIRCRDYSKLEGVGSSNPEDAAEDVTESCSDSILEEVENQNSFDDYMTDDASDVTQSSEKQPNILDDSELTDEESEPDEPRSSRDSMDKYLKSARRQAERSAAKKAARIAAAYQDYINLP